MADSAAEGSIVTRQPSPAPIERAYPLSPSPSPPKQRPSRNSAHDGVSSAGTGPPLVSSTPSTRAGCAASKATDTTPPFTLPNSPPDSPARSAAAFASIPPTSITHPLSNSRPPTPPPPFFKPDLPVPLIPFSHFPKYIGFGTIGNFLYLPWLDVPGQEPIAVPFPPWDAWLESWYRAFDDRAWLLLEIDDSGDRQGLLIRMEKLERAKGTADPYAVTMLEREIRELRQRIGGRLERLLCLHETRKIHLARYRKLNPLPPLETDAEPLPPAEISHRYDEAFSASLSTGFPERNCPLKPGSIWPFALPHPFLPPYDPLDLSTSPTSAFYSPNPSTMQDLRRIMVFDVITPWSKSVCVRVHGRKPEDVGEVVAPDTTHFPAKPSGQEEVRTEQAGAGVEAAFGMRKLRRG